MKRCVTENTEISFMNRNHLKQIISKILDGRLMWDWKDQSWDDLKISQMTKMIFNSGN